MREVGSSTHDEELEAAVRMVRVASTKTLYFFCYISVVLECSFILRGEWIFIRRVKNAKCMWG